MHRIWVAAVAAVVGWSAAGNAQNAPAATRLTLAEAARMAAGVAPAVEAASFRVAGTEARAHQTRAALLPSLSLTAAYFNRSATLASTGFQFPPGLPFELPPLIGPYDNVDGRIRATQSLVDLAGWQHLRADQVQVDGSRADRSAAETAGGHVGARL